MKKSYEVPEMEIDRFLIADIITTSGDDGIGSGDGVVDPWDE